MSHGAVASEELGEETVRAVWSDYRVASISDPLKSMLEFVETMTLRPGELTGGHVESLRAAGLSPAAIDDAIQICGAFNIIARIADALEFDVPSWEQLRKAARILIKRGYR